MKENTLHDLNDMKISHTSATLGALTKQRQEEIKKLFIYLYVWSHNNIVYWVISQRKIRKPKRK